MYLIVTSPLIYLFIYYLFIWFKSHFLPSLFSTLHRLSSLTPLSLQEALAPLVYQTPMKFQLYAWLGMALLLSLDKAAKWVKECTGWFCVSTWHRLELSQRKELQLGKCLHEIQLWGIFSISVQGERAHFGWCHPWAGSLRLYKRAGWGSQGKQATKKHPSMASASAPASWPAWVPILTSFGNEQMYGSIHSINPFLPNLLLRHDVCAGIETLTKGNLYQRSGVSLWQPGPLFWAGLCKDFGTLG